MKVKPSSLLECLHLDPNYMSLTAQNLMVISESFNLLDVQGDELLNDCQVKTLMKHHTDLNKYKRNEIFELIDIYASGFFDLDNYYFFMSIMIAVKDGLEKEFINRHARSLYNLFEVRMKGKMSLDQFAMMGWLFGFDKKAVDYFKQEFDIGPYKKIYLKEFKLFLLTCMEMEEIMDRIERVRAFEAYRNRLIWGLQDQLMDYVKYDKVPEPDELIHKIRWIQRPYLKRGKGVRRLNHALRIRKYFTRQFLMNIGKLTRGTKAHHHCRRGRKCLIKYAKFILRIETPQDKELKKKKMREEDGKKGKKRRRRKWRKFAKKCCKCCVNRKSTHPWGDDNRMVHDDDKHDEVSTASRMPSWIKFIDEEESKHKEKNKLAILDDLLNLEEQGIEEEKARKLKEKAEKKKAKQDAKELKQQEKEVAKVMAKARENNKKK